MKAIRQVGIGDIGHVRQQMLSIALISTRQLPQQLEGCIQAANALKLRVRVHAPVIDPGVEKMMYGQIIRYVSSDHQLLTYPKEVPTNQVATCEIILQPDENENISIVEARDVIISTWNEHGCRFAGGNFANDSIEQLTKMYLKNADPI